MTTKNETKQNRTPREASSRENAARKRGWTPPSMLETPEPPEGYKYRWIRYEANGNEDNKNIVSKLRQGYEPVHIKELPEDYLATKFEEGRYEGVVRSGDLMLAKIPVENVAERSAYYAKENARQEQSIQMALQQQAHSSMPITSQGTQSTASTGSQSFQS